MFDDETLQQIVDAELDAQVLLIPEADRFQVKVLNGAGRALLGEPPNLPDIGAVTWACRDVWESGRPVNLTDILWPHDRRWYDVRIRRVFGVLSVVLTDVTRRHEARDALLDSQCRYRFLAENAGDLVFQVRGRRLEWVSRSVHELLGWDQAEVVGQRVTELVHPDDSDVVVQACSVSGGPAVIEARFRRQDGTWVWLSVEMRPAEDLGGDVARVGSCRAMSVVPAAG